MEKVQTEHILGMLFFGAACRAWGEGAVRGEWGRRVAGKVGKWGEGEKGRRGKKGEKGPFFWLGGKSAEIGLFLRRAGCWAPRAGIVGRCGVPDGENFFIAFLGRLGMRGRGMAAGVTCQILHPNMSKKMTG